MKKAFGNMGVNMKGLNKDQYKIGVDVNQVIWDGGAIKSKNRITQSESEAEKQQVEVELYGLKDRVNALYFGILLLEAQEKENTNMQQLLQSNCEKIQTMKDYFSKANIGAAGVTSSVRILYNPQLKSTYNFVPGIMGLLLLLICAMERVNGIKRIYSPAG